MSVVTQPEQQATSRPAEITIARGDIVTGVVLCSNFDSALNQARQLSRELAGVTVTLRCPQTGALHFFEGGNYLGACQEGGA